MTQNTSLTIRRLDPKLKQKLRMRAAENDRSMEEEVREILRASLGADASSGKKLIASIRGRFAAVGYVDLKLPRREPMREPPEFK